MGIDRLTAITIINNADVMEVITYEATEDDGPSVKGKFGGAIVWGDHPHHPGMPLLSSACI